MVYGGALFVAATYWFLPKRLGGARHFFTGPVRPDDLDENGPKAEFTEKKIVKNERNLTEDTFISQLGRLPS